MAAGCAPKPTPVAPDPEPERESEVQRTVVEGMPLRRVPAELPAQVLPPQHEVTAPVPMSLSATDGTGLKMVSLKARAVVQGPLAFTELHLTFDNPHNRTIEGRFTIDLPPDSAISRFAMKIGPRWQEGEVVERQAARVTYEDFLHRKQDPALLENETGNRFSARVFPIPSRGRKELILSYSQELADSTVPYKLMLAGLPKLEHLDVEILIDTPQMEAGAATPLGGSGETRRVIRLKKNNYVPDRDLRVTADKAEIALGLRNETMVVARVPVTGTMPPDTVEDLTILLDTSASRALDFGGQLHRLAWLVEALRADSAFHLRVVAFDQEASLVFEGDAGDFGPDELSALYSRQALGASDLSVALRSLLSGRDTKRVIIMGDGIATAGLSEVGSLTQLVVALERVGVERLDAIIDGGLQDRDTLAALTTAGLARDGVVVDATAPADVIAKKLSRTTLSDVRVSVPGSRFSWPATLNGVQPGDEILVYAEIRKGAVMTVVLEGETRTETPVSLVGVSRPLVHRALIGARIDSITLRRSQLGIDLVEPRRELAEMIVALSTHNRVLSDFTALLVLETEADYVRFGIDRDALTDILHVDAMGLAVKHRKPTSGRPLWLRGSANASSTEKHATGTLDLVHNDSSHFLAAPSGALAVGSDDEDVWGGLSGTEAGSVDGTGGVALVGTGRGGGGTGEGTVGRGNKGRIRKGRGGGTGSGYARGSGPDFGGRGRRVPRVRQAKATISGSLDNDIVRRIVRSHLNEVRGCYAAGLERDPSLAGRVTVKFDVGSSGRVSVAEIASTSLLDDGVSNCIARAVKRWRFPKPAGGGKVTISYPFVLGRSGSRTARRDAAEERRQVAAQAIIEARIERSNGPYDGRMFDVMSLVERGEPSKALEVALQWRGEAPGDVLALVAMGEALEKLGKPGTAARAYGSVIDLFPSRADMRRFSGSRLDRLGDAGRQLAIDTYRRAVDQRPDHPSSHRQYAYALLRGGQPGEALEAIIVGAEREYPWGRFRGVEVILAEDIGLIAAAWSKDAPSQAEAIRERVHAAGATVAVTASTRFVVSWETDANDVDFHVHDGKGGHAFFSAPGLDSGGTLYADVTTGYGPECFTISGTPDAFPYRLEAHYFSRGPMGYGMGTLQIVQHDGRGGLSFDDRPFVIMKDGAFVELGELSKPLPSVVGP